MFRFLRWLGRAKPSRAAITDSDYKRWVEEMETLRRLTSAHCELSSCNTDDRIAILLNSPGRDRNIERTLDSLRDQTYNRWDLLIQSDSDISDSLAAWIASARNNGHAIEVVPNLEEMRSALALKRREFALLIGKDVILHPAALKTYLSFAHDVTAVYSDWDHIDSSGRRHTPVFTPELSPDLLRRTPYWGACLLARSEALLAVEWHANGDRASEHEVAIGLCGQSARAKRVPDILWHLQSELPAPAVKIEHSPSETASMSVSIVICSRRPELLQRSLKAVRANSPADCEIIVVGHLVQNSSALADIALSHGARFVPYTMTFHFGIMNALGIESSNAEVVCLLNDDVFPRSNQWLDRMVSMAARPDVGVTGALLEFPDGTIQHAGVAVGGRRLPSHPGRFQKNSDLWPWLRTTREVTAVTGACMVFRRSVWNELGGFNLRFPVNFNDIDFCLRARRRGYQVLVEAEAVLTHEESQTRNAVVEPFELSLLYELWEDIIARPDPFFSPQLDQECEQIRLGAPWRHPLSLEH